MERLLNTDLHFLLAEDDAAGAEEKGFQSLCVCVIEYEGDRGTKRRLRWRVSESYLQCFLIGPAALRTG